MSDVLPANPSLMRLLLRACFVVAAVFGRDGGLLFNSLPAVEASVESDYRIPLLESSAKMNRSSGEPGPPTMDSTLV
jgi:hypothetical protein